MHVTWHAAASRQSAMPYSTPHATGVSRCHCTTAFQQVGLQPDILTHSAIHCQADNLLSTMRQCNVLLFEELAVLCNQVANIREAGTAPAVAHTEHLIKNSTEHVLGNPTARACL